jgi:ribulose-5-phosphate 4-epimerase/fuculose-1-phosphate aldolase
LYSSIIDYYKITFDYLVLINNTDPEVLQINIFKIKDNKGIYANKSSCFEINLAVYTRKKVLALPKYCQKKKGTTDQKRVNNAVNIRDGQA